MNRTANIQLMTRRSVLFFSGKGRLCTFLAFFLAVFSCVNCCHRAQHHPQHHHGTTRDKIDTDHHMHRLKVVVRSYRQTWDDPRAATHVRRHVLAGNTSYNDFESVAYDDRSRFYPESRRDDVKGCVERDGRVTVKLRR